MGTAILAYDLKNVKPDDNIRVKNALIQKYTNTFTHLNTQNAWSAIPEWVKLRFPDTTIFVENADAPASAVVKEVISVIESAVGEPSAIFFAYIGDSFLWNDKAQPLSLK